MIVPLLCLLVALQNVVSLDPKFPGVPTDEKPAVSRKDALSRFNDEKQRVNSHLDKCQELQRKLVNYIRTPSTDDYSVRTGKLQEVNKSCEIAAAHVQYLARLQRIDQKLLSQKQRDEVLAILEREREVATSLGYIVELEQQRLKKDGP
jgi:hypothetical protein